MIPFFDISSENSKYLDFFSSELKKFIAEGDYILGNHVEKFESEFACKIYPMRVCHVELHF